MLAENLRIVREKIGIAAERSGRNPDDVKLVAVSKTVQPKLIREAIQLGIGILGENRIQEAESKIPEIKDSAQWHLIGHLQRNKVKKALSLFQYVHSVDSIRLAREISKQAANLNITIPVLLQINVSGEQSKFGAPLSSAHELLEETNGLPGLRVEGLMTIPPFFQNPQQSRPFFIKLRELLLDMKTVAKDPERFRELSMGMTTDFEVAVEEGATFVRIGTAIFGARP